MHRGSSIVHCSEIVPISQMVSVGEWLFLCSFLQGNKEKGLREAKLLHDDCLENYSWRLLKEIKESLPNSIQDMLKNKGGHTKYWLSNSLEMCKLCFYLMCCISMYRIFAAFNKLLQWIPAKPQINKERLKTFAQFCICDLEHSHDNINL